MSVERDGALSAANDALVVGNMERIKEQPRALHHAPLTNIRKCLLRIFAALQFKRSFFFTIYFCNSLFCAQFF